MSEFSLDIEAWSMFPGVFVQGDTFAPPMLTNGEAELQAADDVTAYRFFTCYPLVTAEAPTAELYVRLPEADRFLPVGEISGPISYRFNPASITRECTGLRGSLRGVRFRSELVLDPQDPVVLLRIEIAGPDGRPIDGLRAHLRLAFGVARLGDCSNWNNVAEPVADVEYDEARHAFIADGQGASSIHAVSRPPLSRRSSVSFAEWLGDANLGGIVSGRVRPRAAWGGVEFEIAAGSGQWWRLEFVHALGRSRAEVVEAHDRVVRDPDRVRLRSRAVRQAELDAAFTPGNTRFSGHLPTPVGLPEPAAAIYRSAVLTLLFMRRPSPGAIGSHVYKSISPRSGPTCWLWETQQAAPAIALLDPEVLREMAEWWMRSDIHAGWATNYLDGAVLGTHYSVNDFALFSIARDYLRYTGDRRWLQQKVGPRTVQDHLLACADAWQDRPILGGVVDYGHARNLLECVPTYRHGVASLNAANAWMAREQAILEERAANQETAARLRETATRFGAAVQALYLDGRGYFAARQPDGSRVPVKHCYDFGVVYHALWEELGEQRRLEMRRFFATELQTPGWMRALAADDASAGASLRTDHTATGAYASWPVSALLAYCRDGDLDSALQWIGVSNDSGGIAGVAAQGPFGQGTFHGAEGSLLVGRAARKAPDAPPHYEEWIDLAGAGFVAAIVEGLFGLEASLTGIAVRRPGISDRGPIELRHLRVCQIDRTITSGELVSAR